MNWATSVRGDLMYEALANRLGVTWEVTHPTLLKALNSCHAWYRQYGPLNSPTYALAMYALIFRIYFPEG